MGKYQYLHAADRLAVQQLYFMHTSVWICLVFDALALARCC